MAITRQQAKKRDMGPLTTESLFQKESQWRFLEKAWKVTFCLLPFILYFSAMTYMVRNKTSIDSYNNERICEIEEKKRKKNHFAKLWQQVKSIPIRLVPSKKSRNLSKELTQAYTYKPNLSRNERMLLIEFANRVHNRIPELYQRAGAVSWGGKELFWNPTGNRTFGSNGLESLDGGLTLYSYYQIMKAFMKNTDDLSQVAFPFSLCKQHTCSAEKSIEHTLEWREKYKPWLVTPSTVEENSEGWIYVRGLAKGTDYGQHAMVWSRPGIHETKDDLAYIRAVMNTLDRAVSESLFHSHGRVGRFNVLIDCSHYEWTKMPSQASLKQMVVMLQDHYPHRLGMIFLMNMSRAAELMVNIVKQFITKEVREKIFLLSHNPEQRKVQVEALVEKRFIPTWLDGGQDMFTFDKNAYYPHNIRFKEDKGAQFLKSMPY